MSLISKLLIKHHCVSPQKTIVWEKVAQHPTLVQHILLHLTQICNDTRFLPEAIVIQEPSLLPLALALCSEWVIPLQPAVLNQQATLVLNTAGPSHRQHNKRLEINLLATRETP